MLTAPRRDSAHEYQSLHQGKLSQKAYGAWASISELKLFPTIISVFTHIDEANVVEVHVRYIPRPSTPIRAHPSLTQRRYPQKNVGRINWSGILITWVFILDQTLDAPYCESPVISGPQRVEGLFVLWKRKQRADQPSSETADNILEQIPTDCTGNMNNKYGERKGVVHHESGV